MSNHPNHIVVVSHRRSGTHLTIDAILNNFKEFEKAELLTFRQLVPGWEKSLDLEEYRSKVNDHPIVFKSHFLPDPHQYFPEDEQKGDFLEEILQSTPKIYVYRDGRDVMVSLYNYMKSYELSVRELNFSEFLKTGNHFGPPEYLNYSRPAFWKVHVQSWLNELGILPLSFELLVNDYDSCIRKIARHLNLPVPDKVIDVRMNKSNFFSRLATCIQVKPSDTIRRTTVLFDGGKPGRFTHFFSDSDLGYFKGETDNILSTLKYD